MFLSNKILYIMKSSTIFMYSKLILSQEPNILNKARFIQFSRIRVLNSPKTFPFCPRLLEESHAFQLSSVGQTITDRLSWLATDKVEAFELVRWGLRAGLIPSDWTLDLSSLNEQRVDWGVRTVRI